MVVALWPVPDAQTGQLMRGLYERLATGETVDVASALREAMLETKAAQPARMTAEEGLSEWGSLLVLGAGTVRLRVASSLRSRLEQLGLRKLLPRAKAKLSVDAYAALNARLKGLSGQRQKAAVVEALVQAGEGVGVAIME
eukprot:COSAG01_NODE_4929_length_4614_cov_15.381395_6_plen_141_part_00